MDLYGPPHYWKTNFQLGESGLQSCIRPVLEETLPSADGIRTGAS